MEGIFILMIIFGIIIFFLIIAIYNRKEEREECKIAKDLIVTDHKTLLSDTQYIDWDSDFNKEIVSYIQKAEKKLDEIKKELEECEHKRRKQ